MKTIGLLALSPAQARAFLEALGPDAEVETLVIDEPELRAAQAAEGWSGAAEIIEAAGRELIQAGAGVLAITSVPVYKTLPLLGQDIQEKMALPALAAARYAAKNGPGKLALLADRFSCYDGFFRDAFSDFKGGRLILPEPADVEFINALMKEAAQGQRALEADEKAELERIMATAARLGAGAMLAADSGLAKLLGQSNWPLPVISLTNLLADLALELALGGV